ncbi:MAG TPA: hypothetical protein VGL56_05505 [Fimbriimonadaceae bacterium]
MISEKYSDIYEMGYERGGHATFHSKLFAPTADAENTVSPWDAFVHFDLPYNLFLNEMDMSLAVAAKRDDAKLIEKVSKTEHRNIADEFLISRAFSEGELPIKTSLKNALAQDNYWPGWNRALRLNDSIYREWVSYRRSSIEALFLSRLAGLDLDEATKTKLLQSLSARPRPVKRTYLSPSKEVNRLKANHPDQLRTFLVGAIEQMPLADLLKLWIPVSAITELFDDRKSK